MTTNDALDSWSRKVTLLQNGNVGIGTAGPDAKLEVSGEAILAPISQPVSPQPGMIYYDQTSHVMRYYKGGSSPGWVDMGARVSLGEWTSTATLAGGGTETITDNRVYVAQGDGFVMAGWFGQGGGNDVYAYSGTSSTNLIVRCRSGRGDFARGASITMPVKKGHYWKVVDTNTQTYWVPLGD